MVATDLLRPTGWLTDWFRSYARWPCSSPMEKPGPTTVITRATPRWGGKVRINEVLFLFQRWWDQIISLSDECLTVSKWSYLLITVKPTRCHRKWLNVRDNEMCARFILFLISVVRRVVDCSEQYLLFFTRVFCDVAPLSFCKIKTCMCNLWNSHNYKTNNNKMLYFLWPLLLNDFHYKRGVMSTGGSVL